MMLRTLLTRFQPQKGFDSGILPSPSALSRMQKNTVWLYEQGASKRRVWMYWMRWLAWAFGVCAGMAVASVRLGNITGYDATSGMVAVFAVDVVNVRSIWDEFAIEWL